MEKAVCAKTAVVSPKVIDEINILQATYEAMRQAISMLEPQPTLLLNDAVNIPGEPMKQVSIIKGDAKSISIGAASIIAKVTRDAMMVEYDKIYPEYDFASNKGLFVPQLHGLFEIAEFTAVNILEILGLAFVPTLIIQIVKEI